MDYKERYEDLLRENALLHDYIHIYQKELEKYSSQLDKLDKCTEKDTYYASLDLKRRQERQEAIVRALWESIDWIAKAKEWSGQKILKKVFCFCFPNNIYLFFSLVINNYRAIKKYHDKFGVDKTVNLLESLPLLLSEKAKIWTELARHCKDHDNNAALKYSIHAWKEDPKAYRLKFLAFNMYRTGENEKALAFLEGLPQEQILSDSERRLFAKIMALAEYE